MKPVQHVLIVGGGTAGWLTAAYLAKTLGCGTPGSVRVTLLESSAIPTIGVGEGSFPSLRGTLSTLGIAEHRFVREAQATFKQGIRFDHWVRPPGSPAAAGAGHYFHPFNHPSQRPGGPELLPYWLLGAAPDGLPFAAATTMQKRVVDAARAPKRSADADYVGPMNYAYHFDAGALATLLATQARALGVAHVLGTVQHVSLRGDGGIAAVHTPEQGALTADLYIDCTGFRATLIGAALGSPLKPAADTLFVDRALALQVPYEDASGPIASCTIATAQAAGWTWDIGLQQRRGVGYAYSSRHSSAEAAAAALRAHIGPAAKDLHPRELTLEVGFRERQWVQNCVAVGLSGGFVEPLEASGVGLVETAAYLLAHLFPFDGNLAPVAKRFNGFMARRYERVLDFVKLHYALTQRRDTAFWRDNADPASWSAGLRERLAMWRSRPPHRLDFDTDIEMYPPCSWQYVLYGMEHTSELSAQRGAWPRFADAQQEFATLAQVAERALADLPSHRSLVQAMCARV